MSALAVRHDGLPLGIVAQDLWVRQQRSPRSDKGKPDFGGENVHWLDVIEATRSAFASRASEATPWYQLDRGADCWQVLAYAERADLLITVRAVHDRRLDARAARLWDAVRRARVIAQQTIEIPARPAKRTKRRLGRGRREDVVLPAVPARQARVTIRACRVPIVLSLPTGDTTVHYNAVLVRERDRSKRPVEWLLLTTHSIKTRADVQQVVRGYALRWRIEDFHRVWKRGHCNVESTQLRSRDAIFKWATLLATVATRAMRLTHQARKTPDAPASTELTKLELEALIALRQPKNLPDREPTLGEAVRWIADLGGYIGPRNGPPGAIVIGRGLHDVLVAAKAFELRDKQR
jgi:hypothetical protein